MHFDDRLGTVLRSSAESKALSRIQFRQLLDLLGTLPSEARSDQIDAAYARMGKLCESIPAADRAAMLGEAGLRLRNPRLVAALATCEPQVAEMTLSRASLSTEEWLDLAPALPLHARGLMRRRSDLGPEVEALMARLGIRERGLPPADAAPVAAEPEPVELVLDTPITAPAEEPFLAEPIKAAPAPEGSIRAIVERIEGFRHARQTSEAPSPSPDHPRLPLGDTLREVPPPRAFDFTADTDGRIVWASPGMAAMAVGLRLAPGDGTGALTGGASLATALRRRQPLRDEPVTITGAPQVSGEWKLSATPRFEPSGGQFLGYHGRFRRPAAQSASDPELNRSVAEGERIRQMLHELRTPVNAIQGFAEVIQQQLFGSTPHEYRALAANIASDAARMLAGFEELERLARLDSGAMQLDPGSSDLAEILSGTAAQLNPFLASRQGQLDLSLDRTPLGVPLASEDAARLVWRLLATLAGAAHPGETLAVRARARDGRVRVTLTIPASLAAREGENLFLTASQTTATALSAGMFGAGFALRLARAEAKAVGGKLERKDQTLVLDLPGLTLGTPEHSDNQRQQAPGAQ